MKSMAEVTMVFTKIPPRLAQAVIFAIAACVLTIAQPSPQVYLDADGLAPRPIEELTGTTIARHYAQAWHDLAEVLESGRVEGLGEEFIGFAKDRLVQRIDEQKQAGLHVRVVDHGHRLKAVFYSTDGAAMQLLDEAQLEIQTFDGNKLLDTQNGAHEYVVLITPGTDRWQVRYLEEVSEKPF
jgi:hypothetical protein